ncbi:MAG: L-histidine N(alpha)-methyltransferase [Actinobacteria bacterium]|nr:L-histidine N(alpha)-methyltransferase [Actinomycetota bacterium]
MRRLTQGRPLREQLADDVRAGFGRSPKVLPPKYLYDERGSELFETITELPEYYPTRTEATILSAHVDRLVEDIRPEELVELGSGSSRKTRMLLEAMHRSGSGNRYVPLEISETALEGAALELLDDYPWLEVHGHLGDFATDLPSVSRSGRRIIAFLGSTIGNLLPAARAALLERVADSMQPGDVFLLGADLVKSPATLVPAYDDAAGVTADFNRNMLTVLNRELDGDLPVDAFEHRAVWNAGEARIEMHLVAREEVTGRLDAIELDVRFAPGEPLVTEYSCKFEVAGLTGELGVAGLETAEVWTDDRRWFSVFVARRTDSSAPADQYGGG